MATELTIHGTGSGTCSLTAKTGDGLTVTFKDGTVTEAFLCWKGFQQLLALKAGKNGKATAKGAGVTETIGTPVGRGTTEVVGGSTGHPEGISNTRTVAAGSVTSGGTTGGGK